MLIPKSGTNQTEIPGTNRPKSLAQIEPKYPSLIEFLKLHSNGFEKWRYVYEIEEQYYSYEFNFNLMNEFIKALLNTIDEIIMKND